MIRVLDKFISDKIAAGEVIERPVSAVKELIENSIDAGARSIITEIRGGGKTYIRVTDDGCGIPSSECETAFLRHATSKISGIADLDNICSLGFRGEALASIAAVSKLTLVTRTTEEQAGTRLMMHGGHVVSREAVGANTGTTIVVEDIFYNTPARRKFMRSDAREGSAIIELIQQYAVCYSDIRFMMIRNGETVFTTEGRGDTLAVIRKLYPDTAHADLISVSGRNVCGYVSDPGTTLTTRRGQLFFVNGRLVSSKAIEKGLEQGYRRRIFSGHPVAILFIECEPSDIDVNIHPGKREIKFLRESDIIESVSEAVDSAMQTKESVPRGKIYAIEDGYGVCTAAEETGDKLLTNPNGHITDGINDRAANEFKGEQASLREYLGSLKRDDTVSLLRECTDSKDEDRLICQTEIDQRIPRAPEMFCWDDLEYRGYLFDTYIVMQSADTVYLFDQHAAHERIFYERLTGNYLSEKKFTQPVLTPVTINVSADVYYRSRAYTEPLQSMGYDISDFGANTFIIRGIPSYMTMDEAARFAEAFIEELEDASEINSVVIDKLIMRSCKSAVKGGDRLSVQEIKALIRDLESCRNPYSCPHGRPTFIRYTKNEIERSFRRK